MEIKKLGRIIVYGCGFLGAVAAIITIVKFTFDFQEPNLVFEVTSSVDAIDVNNPVEGLDVRIGDVDILGSEKSIRIVELQIRNSGGGDILKTFYDENAPLGLKLRQGKFLSDPALVSASNSYLNLSAQFNRINSNKLLFTPVIIDSGQWIRFRLTILYDSSDDFDLKPIGKIAGQQDIQLVHNIRSEQPSFLDRVFLGSIPVQFVRAIGYSLGLLILSSIVGLMIAGLLSIGAKLNRIKVLKKFKRQFPEISESIWPILVDYRKDGAVGINYIGLLLEEDEVLNNYLINLDKSDTTSYHISHARFNRRHLGYHSSIILRVSLRAKLDDLIDHNIIYKEENCYHVSQEIRQSLQEFMQFLKNNQTKDFNEIKYPTHYYNAREVFESRHQ